MNEFEQDFIVALNRDEKDTAHVKAKGDGDMARKILEIAHRHDIP